jgi:hypothetical protein
MVVSRLTSTESVLEEELCFNLRLLSSLCLRGLLGGGWSIGLSSKSTGMGFWLLPGRGRFWFEEVEHGEEDEDGDGGSGQDRRRRRSGC